MVRRGGGLQRPDVDSRSLMGHLAERYRDASRSGVYRVTDGAVPRAAAREAGSGTRVLVLDGLDHLVGDDLQVILAALEQVAAAGRASGTPFFAVLVDPRRRLALPELYKEKS
jgi:hypothetical protein